MPAAHTIENWHLGHADWLAHAAAHYAAMSTAALAGRLHEDTGRLTVPSHEVGSASAENVKWAALG